jgi:hypothetical protein
MGISVTQTRTDLAGRHTGLRGSAATWLRGPVLASIIIGAVAALCGAAPALAQTPTLAVKPVLDVGPVLSASRDGLSVRVALPDAAQAQRIFGVPVLDKGIQPVWVEIANAAGAPAWYMPITTDPTYFSPMEAAYRFNEVLRGNENAARAALFMALRMPLFVPPGATVSGFVFTHRERGLKFLSIGVLRGGERIDFPFVVEVPGSAVAGSARAIMDRYGERDMQDVDLEALRQRLEAMPCCTRNEAGTRDGDPLNVVVIGDGVSTLFPFVRRGWRYAQPLGIRSAAEMAAAFVLRFADDTAPVSPLYLFGRPQDLAIQKARNTINERNHMRLWLTPLRYKGQSVWMGQISRDIGIEYTTQSWYGTTHKIDPQVDFDREYLLQDLMMASAIERFGYVKGVGPSSAADPRVNLTGDPFVTDGMRLVVFLRSPLVRDVGVTMLDWERPRD